MGASWHHELSIRNKTLSPGTILPLPPPFGKMLGMIFFSIFS
jgi:hypothetical protein